MKLIFKLIIFVVKETMTKKFTKQNYFYRKDIVTWFYFISLWILENLKSYYFFFIFILGGQISIATGGEKKGIETEFVAW